MKKLKYIYLVVFMIAVSCTDQSTFNNPAIFELENGSMVRFDALPATSFDSVEGFGIQGKLHDVNGNTSSYDLHLTATISGQVISAENIWSTKNFPADIDLTVADFASALGLEVSDIKMGDFFQFYGTSTRNDGTVFHGTEPDYGNDKDNGKLGFTQGNLNSNASYKSAMSFNAILACPVPATLYVGKYEVTGDMSTGTFAATFALPKTVTLEETSVYQRTFEINYLEALGIGQPDMDFTIDFICGNATAKENLDTYLACGGGLVIGGATPLPYDESDDSSLTINFTDNVLGDCGSAPVVLQITLTKIED